MFSGIIEDLGTLISVSPRGNGRSFVLRTALSVDEPTRPRGEGERPGLRLGDSVAVNGACLTVEACMPPDQVRFAVGFETLERTTLGALRPGARVHLERALRLGDRLDGHLVSGHVDGVAEVRSVERIQESVVMWAAVPDGLARYVAEKGSICLDGVSLTVNEVSGASFRVNLVPFTADHTTLASHRPGDRVNVEVDLLARYLERLLGAQQGHAGLSRERLEALGFVSPRSSK